MMAAVQAARNGAEVIILEKNDRMGKKLLTTGNGRCNITNELITAEHYHGNNPSFIINIINQFNKDKTLSFFKELGLEFITGENGKIFPRSRQASSVLDLLRLEIEKLNINLVCQTEITSIIQNNDGTFELTDKNGRAFECDKTILACGGKAAPHTGSDGGGFRLAQIMKHNIIHPFPALVQLKLSGDVHKSMEKMNWAAEVSLYINNNIKKHVADDIIFTNYGISGLAVLDLSRSAVEGIMNRKTVEIGINFLPDLTLKEKIANLNKRVENHPERLLENFLTGILNKRIGQTIIKSAGLKLNQKASELSEKDINSIAEILNGWKFIVAGDTGWNNAQITAGGVSCSEIDTLTLESKLNRSLYFCGEILDIDGDSGGYNLQWAWSSGYVAGNSASKGD